MHGVKRHRRRSMSGLHKFLQIELVVLTNSLRVTPAFSRDWLSLRF